MAAETVAWFLLGGARDDYDMDEPGPGAGPGYLRGVVLWWRYARRRG